MSDEVSVTVIATGFPDVNSPDRGTMVETIGQALKASVRDLDDDVFSDNLMKKNIRNSSQRDHLEEVIF